MRAPKGWCEPQLSHNNSSHPSNMSHPISIPSCDTIDESDVPVFLRDDLDLSHVTDERDWTGMRVVFDNSVQVIILFFLRFCFFFCEQCQCTNTRTSTST